MNLFTALLLLFIASAELLVILKQASFVALSFQHEYLGESNNNNVLDSDDFSVQLFNQKQNQDFFQPLSDSSSSNGSSISLPIDIYLLMDASGSIDQGKKRCKNATKEIFPDEGGKTCWQLFVHFADEIQSGVAKLAGGYADTPDAGGLRLSIYTFSCREGVPITRKILTGPTGNMQSIADAFAKLDKITPSDGTCPSEGLNFIRKEIEATINSGNERFSGVLILTDGIIDDKRNERDKSKNEASQILSKTDTSIFAVSVASKPNDQQQQSDMLAKLTNDPNKIFPVEKEESLSSIQSILSASLGNNFVASFNFANQPQEAVPYGGNGIDQICIGASANVKLTGRSIQYLSRETIQCNFTRPLLPYGTAPIGERQSIVNAVLEPETGYRTCQLPGSFMKNFTSKVVLQLSVLNGGNYQSIGPLLVLPTINMVPCTSSNYQISQDKCIIGGSNTAMIFSGPSVAYALPRLTAPSSSFYPLICVYSRPGLKITRPAIISPTDKQQILCSIDSDDDIKSILQAKLYPSPIISISLAIGDVNWLTTEKSFNPIGDFPIGLISTSTIPNSGAYPNAVSNGCISFSGLSDTSSCWTGVTDDTKGPYTFFNGKTVTLLSKYFAFYKSNGKFGFQCSFSQNGVAMGSTNATLVIDGIPQPVIRCVIPSTLLQTSNGDDSVSKFRVGLYLTQISDGFMTLLSNNPSSGFDSSIIVKSCFTISYASKSCVGEEHEFNVTGDGVSQVPSNVDLVCQFDDSANDVSVKVTAKKYGSGTISCSEPASIGQYSGVFFDTLTLRDKVPTGKIYFKVKDISFGLELCFDFDTRYFPTGNNFCWGYSPDATGNAVPSLVVRGSSTRYLAASREKISIVFTDDVFKQDDVVIPDYYGSNSLDGEFIAPFPSSSTKKPIGLTSFTAKLLVGFRSQATYRFSINIVGCSNVEQTYTPSVANENPGNLSCWPFCCYRDGVDVSITGQNAIAFSNEAKALCQFSIKNKNGISTVVATSKILSNGLAAAKCSAPGWTPFQDSDTPQGVYDSISVIMPATKTTPMYEVIKAPIASSNQLCMSTSYNQNLTWGQPLEVSVHGTSLFSFALWGSRDKVNWLNLLKCSLVDVTTKAIIIASLPVVWDKFTGVLSCQRPGTFDIDELKSTAMRVVLQKPSSGRLRRSLQVQSDIVLVNDLVVDVNFQNPFSFGGASASCLLNGRNNAKIVVNGVGPTINSFGSFKCSFADSSGKNVFTSGINYRTSLDGSMTCSVAIPSYKSVSTYSVSFESTTKLGTIFISSGALDTSSACFLGSVAPTFSPTRRPTTSPTIRPSSSPTLKPTLSPTISPTFSPTKSPTFSPTMSPTSSPTNATASPTVYIIPVVKETTTVPPTLPNTENLVGVYAAIGVVLGVFGVFLLMILLFVLMRKKNKKEKDIAPTKSSVERGVEKTKSVRIVEEAIREDDLITTTASASVPNVYKLGDRVEVMIEFNTEVTVEGENPTIIDQDEQWLKGTVVSIAPSRNEIGTYLYTISYDASMNRPQTDRQISATQMRKMKSDYRVGYIVDCFLQEKGIWEKATIIEVLPNNKYSIEFIPNDRESRERKVQCNVDGEARLRPHNPKHALDDVVEANVADTWKRATVKNVISSDLYEVVLDKEEEKGEAVQTALSSSIIEANDEALEIEIEQRSFIVSSENIRKLQFKAGDHIEILKGASWLNGEVVKVQRNQKYEVEILPGTDQMAIEYNVPAKRLRRRRTAYSRVIGDLVEVLQSDDVTWRRARIIDILGPNLYNVTYNEDRRRSTVIKEDGTIVVSPEKMPLNEVPEKRIRSPIYYIGDMVEAKALDGWFEKGSWNIATVTAVHDDGTFDVAFLDSSFGVREHVTQELIKRVEGVYTYGDHVEYLIKGQWRDGVVLKSLSNNNYVIKNTHFGTETTVSGSSMRWPSYSVGDSVMVLLDKKKNRNGPQMLPADIISIDKESKTVDVRFEDSEIEQSVPYSRIKKYSSIEETKAVIEEAMTSGFRPPAREHDIANEADAIDPSLRYQRRPPISAKLFMGNRYAVTVIKEYGLGVTFGWTNEQVVVVDEFKDLSNGDWGPLEACGLVGLRDQLLEVNEQNIEGMSFDEVTDLINRSSATITLTFKRASTEMINF